MLESIPGVRVNKEGGAGRREPDDGCAGSVCGRRHGALRAHRHHRHRPRQEGGAPYGCLAARSPTTNRSSRWWGRSSCSSGSRPMRLASSQPVKPASARDDFGEIIGGWMGAAPLRGGALLLLRQLLRVRRLLWRLPEQAIAKLGPGKAIRWMRERCTGCGACHDQCPLPRHRGCANRRSQ